MGWKQAALGIVLLAGAVRADDIDTWVDWLDSLDEKNRAIAMEELAKAGPDAFDAVERQMKADNWLTRRRAITLLVGYAKQMRCSNSSAMGGVPQEVFTDNVEEWSADHCMDHEAVPGVLFTSRPLKKPAPSLENLAAAILAEFGIEGFEGDAEEQLRSVGYISASH